MNPHEELFSINVISAIRENKNGFVMTMPSLWIVFWKRPFHIYIYTPIYVHICEEFLPNAWSLNLALAFQTQYFDWRLTQFAISPNHRHAGMDRGN